MMHASSGDAEARRAHSTARHSGVSTISAGRSAHDLVVYRALLRLRRGHAHADARSDGSKADKAWRKRITADAHL